MTLIEHALKLHALTDDPLILDAIRALATPSTPPAIRNTVEQFIEAQYEAYLILFQNSGTNPTHGNRQ